MILRNLGDYAWNADTINNKYKKVANKKPNDWG